MNTRIDVDRLHHESHPQPPMRLVKPSFWQRLLARLSSPPWQSDPIGSLVMPPKPVAPARPITPGVQRLLDDLAERAWRRQPRYPTGRFLLSSSALAQGASVETMESNLKVLYEHARRWAPGLDVPYHLPRVRISEAIAHPGDYRVDGDGWVSINVSAEFASRSLALHVILAHEACHHILHQSGLADRRDVVRDERMTDLAMFIVGFGDIVRAGRAIAAQTPGGYISAHLGYLEGADYDFAFNWVLDVRTAIGLPSEATSSPPEARERVHPHLPDPIEQLHQALRRRYPNPSVRERWIEHIRNKHPSESEERILQRVLDAADRDCR